MATGTCLCGTLRYEIAGPFTMMMHCHCSMCRKHHGAVFATFVGADLGGFRWIEGRDAIVSYESSEHAARSFCRHCGSVAPTLVPDMGSVFAPAGCLEGDLKIEPQGHMFAASKASWHPITDSLPQHAGMPKEYGGGMGVARPAVAQRDGVADGSCLCGAVAYEFRAPIRMYHCHCGRCRRARGAAHTTNLFAKVEDFVFTRGEDLVQQYKVPEAARFGVAFCTRCGGKVPRVSRERGTVVTPGRRARYGSADAAAGEHLRRVEGAVVRHHRWSAAVRRDAARLASGFSLWHRALRSARCSCPKGPG